MVVPNPYLNYATRQVRLTRLEKSKVLDFDNDTGETWQAWIFSNDANDKSTEVEFIINGSFGTTGTITTTIGGGGIGGGLITATGSCSVFATGQNNNLISVWFTPEQTSTSLPPIAQSFNINTSPTYFNVGYPPFQRKYCSVMSTGSYTLQLLNEDGNAIFNTVVNTTEEKNFFAGRFVHPPNTQLQLLNGSANQKFIVTHFI